MINSQTRNAGDILKAKRLSLGFSIESVSKKLKIQPKYLTSLEENFYDLFDSRAIAMGFLKKYSNFLGLDTESVLAFWRRDFTVSVKNTPPSLENSKKIFLTPTFLVILLSLSVVLGFLYLGLIQNSAYNTPPKLEIFSPKDGEVVYDSNVVLKGKVSSNSEVWLNSRLLSIDSSGVFIENILLHKGINTLVIKALNPSNLEITKSLNVENKIQGDDFSGEGPNKLSLVISNPTSVFIEVKDGSQTVYRGFLLGPTSKEFRGNKVKIYIDRLENVKINYNGEDLEFSGIKGDFYRDFTQPSQ